MVRDDTRQTEIPERCHQGRIVRRIGPDVHTMPPPGSGRTLLFTLMMTDMIPLDQHIEDEATRYLLFIRILRKALLERSDRPFDPNFFPQIAADADMLDPGYCRECLAAILKDVDRSILPFIPSEDELSGETTHLSVIDETPILMASRVSSAALSVPSLAISRAL